jgi:hypothetical protein
VGLRVAAQRAEVCLLRPALPRFLSELTIRGLAVGDARVDLRLERTGDALGLTLLRRAPGVRVILAS